MRSQQIVDLLNELHGLDPTFLDTLIEHRVPCNKAIEDHPSVTVHAEKPEDPGVVGLLGIIEGIVGIDGDIIMADYDADKKLIGFHLAKPGEVRREFSGHVPPSPAKSDPLAEQFPNVSPMSTSTLKSLNRIPDFRGSVIEYTNGETTQPVVLVPARRVGPYFEVYDGNTFVSLDMAEWKFVR